MHERVSQKKKLVLVIVAAEYTRGPHSTATRSDALCARNSVVGRSTDVEHLLEVGAPLVVGHLVVALLLDLGVLLEDIRHGRLSAVRQGGRGFR